MALAGGREPLEEAPQIGIAPLGSESGPIEDVARSLTTLRRRTGTLVEAAVVREESDAEQDGGLSVAEGMVPSSGIQQHGAAALTGPPPGIEVRIR